MALVADTALDNSQYILEIPISCKKLVRTIFFPISAVDVTFRN